MRTSQVGENSYKNENLLNPKTDDKIKIANQKETKAKKDSQYKLDNNIASI